MGKNGDQRKQICTSLYNGNLQRCISKHHEWCKIDWIGVQVFPKVLLCVTYVDSIKYLKVCRYGAWEVERQQWLWHTPHVTNLTRRPQQQWCLPPPPYWLPTTTAHLAPNAATPCHQPSPPPHQQWLQPRPWPWPHRQQHPCHQTITSNKERTHPHPQSSEVFIVPL